MTIVVLGFVAMTLFGSSNLWNSRHNVVTFVAVVFVLIVISLFDLYVRMGYSVSYNETGISWLKSSIFRNPDHAIRMDYDRISSVESIQSTIGISPFEAVLIRSLDDYENIIILSRQYLIDDDIEEILRRIAAIQGAEIGEDIRTFYNI